MPTFRNDGLVAYKVEDAEGQSVSVSPGESVESFRMLPEPFTKTSDDPIYTIADVVYEQVYSATGLGSAKHIRIHAGDMDSHMACNTDEGEPQVVLLPAGSIMDIQNNGEISALYFFGDNPVTVETYSKEPPTITFRGGVSLESGGLPEEPPV